MSGSTEIAVIGAGPAGQTAALAARRAGASVMLFDAYARPGGQYYRQSPDRLAEEMTHRRREGRQLWRQVEASGVVLRSGAQVWNLTTDRMLSVASTEGSETYHAQAVIVASGAYERVIPFPGWTLPGVITSGAAQTLLDRGVLPGRRALVAGTGPLNLVTAADLLGAGVAVVAVLEGADLLRRGPRHATAFWGQWERLREGFESYAALARCSAPYRMGWGLAAAHGGDFVEGATICQLDADWRLIPGTEQQLACDFVCVSNGLAPFSALLSVAGAQLEWRPELGGQVPIRDATFCTTVPGVYAVGDGAGIRGARMAMLEGEVAGIAAAGLVGYGAGDAAAALTRLRPALAGEERFGRAYAALFTPGPGAFDLAREDTVVCRCEGVTLGMLRRAAAEGAATFIEAKAGIRCGMGECQGRMCDQAIAQMLARLTERGVDEIGLNRARPPIMALPLSALTPKE